MYSDKYGNFFGRLNDDTNVVILHVEDGEAATRVDANVWPVGSRLGARWEHPAGIVLTVQDAESLGIEIER